MLKRQADPLFPRLQAVAHELEDIAATAPSALLAALSLRLASSGGDGPQMQVAGLLT